MCTKNNSTFTVKFAVAYGTTRTVFLILRWAIKIPSFVEWRLFLLGLLANMQETKFSKTGWPELCPILFSISGGWVVIMARAHPLTREQFNEIDFDLWLNCVPYTIPVEKKMDSFGLLDGRLVAVDYGN